MQAARERCSDQVCVDVQMFQVENQTNYMCVVGRSMHVKSITSVDARHLGASLSEW